jgi:transposase InsO family protein
MPRLGGKKLYYLLRHPLQSLKVGRDKFFDILRVNRLLIKPKRQYHVTTDSHHRFKKHKNLIEAIEIAGPEQVLVSDITYVGNRKHPMYLALVTDAYSKKIMGYNLSKSLGAQGANSALKMALKTCYYSNKNIIHHSDRGVQYCCDLYQKTLKKAKVQCSMTEKYDPYQNAVAERINGILKQEFLCGIQTNDFNLMKTLIDSSIKIYNEQRPHFSNFMLTPKQMHQQSIIKMRTYKKQKTEHQNDLVLS